MTPDLQPTFRALADPTRRDILFLLGEREMTVGEVSERFDMTRAAVKKHLSVLEAGNLIHSRAEGRRRLNRLNPQGLRPIADWLGYFDQFWDAPLAKLQSTLATVEKDKTDDNDT